MKILGIVKNSFSNNKAVFYSIATNIVALIFGPLTVYFIAHFFSKEVQGYHYTFGSLIILQTLLELGMGQAIIQFISNEWGKLSILNFAEINFKEQKFQSIKDLVQLAISWYTMIALFVLFIMLPLGYFFFITTNTPANINWVTPWIFLCIFISLNVLLMPFFYFLQGCNKVKSYWFYRFLQQGISGIVAIIAIISGAALYTYSLISLSILATSILFLAIKYKKIIIDIINTFNFKFNRSKMKEVWALQWKIALSTLTTIYTLQAFVPILFKYQGPVVAGQMGMSLTLTNILLGISSNWFIVNAPMFGILIASNQISTLHHLFKKSLIMAISFATIGAIILIVLIRLIEIYYFELAERILPLNIISLLLLSIIINTILFSFSTYFRSHRKEPLIYVYALSNAFILSTAPFVTQHFDTFGLIFLYLTVLTLIQLPVGLKIFFVFKKNY